MKTLEEIKQLFAHKNYIVRGEFIDDYHFEDDYRDYYHDFILHARDVKDRFYLSDLIDLAGWLGFYDIALRERYYAMLFEKRHFLIKLAVLDYFKYCKKELLFSSYVTDLEKLSKQIRPEIVRSQVIFNLICSEDKEREKYVTALIQLIWQTNNWWVLHRLLNNMNEMMIDKELLERLCNAVEERMKVVRGSDDTLKLLTEVKAK